MSEGEGKQQNITRDEWRIGENYRALLEMSGGEGKLQNISGDGWRRGKTKEQLWR